MICEVCGKNNEPKYRVTREYLAKRKYCSYECSDKARIGVSNSSKGKARISLEERFWSKVKKGESNECWEWQGTRENFGYGFLYKTGRKGWHKSHRLSWELHFGEIPQGASVCHTCDNPPCVNPKHLWLGTNAENNFDRIAKGRTANHVGEKNPRAKLKKEDIMKIKELRKTGLSQQKIAGMFSVSQYAISAILLGKTWKHLSSSEI